MVTRDFENESVTNGWLSVFIAVGKQPVLPMLFLSYISYLCDVGVMDIGR